MRIIYRNKQLKNSLLKILFGFLFAIITILIIVIHKNIITGLIFVFSGSIALGLIISGLVILLRGVPDELSGQYPQAFGPYCHYDLDNKGLQTPGFSRTCHRCS